ncbi:hypothetical protein EQ500_00220 [Lactobacillus sp. XV13L]|nr:hypothetical protein [Lactobacillus sp. XV13L]
MKKVISACLTIVTILSYLIVINFYQSKDYDQVAKMGQTSDSYQIYLQDSQIAPSAQLVFFKQLARKDGLSIILTTKGANNSVEKSVVANPATFPVSSFRLDQVNLNNDKDYYASFKTAAPGQKGTIPVFAKNNRVILQPMGRYFKSKKTVDGVYTIVPGKSDRKTILTQLARFYGIPRIKLITPTTGMSVEYLTKPILILSFI